MSINLSINDQISYLSSYKNHFVSNLEDSLVSNEIKTLQLNIGRKCNQACHHCHVDASPLRTETMSQLVLEKCLDIIQTVSSIESVDITGGAPEINTCFTQLVEVSKSANKHVIDRCNLTILEEPDYSYLYDFLKKNQVEIIASLPHYTERRTDSQRGTGVFEKSIRALQKLNEIGYGKENSTLKLNLVYNPSGYFLADNQETLEREFKLKLWDKYQIVFNQLYCINNMPISRFLQSLIRKGNFLDYMDTLANAYNPRTVDNLMCRSQISISYDGFIYDCDFNQMLDIKSQSVSHVDQWNFEKLRHRKIKTANHCYGCTAGSGSSCGGAIS